MMKTRKMFMYMAYRSLYDLWFKKDPPEHTTRLGYWFMFAWLASASAVRAIVMTAACVFTVAFWFMAGNAVEHLPRLFRRRSTGAQAA